MIAKAYDLQVVLSDCPQFVARSLRLRGLNRNRRQGCAVRGPVQKGSLRLIENASPCSRAVAHSWVTLPKHIARVLKKISFSAL